MTKARYIKTHEGHMCTVTGVIADDRDRVTKIHVRCDCGPYLYLNPRDVVKGSTIELRYS